MNTKILIGGFIALVIAIGVFFLLTGKANAPEDGLKEATDSSTAATTEQTQIGSGSLRTLFGSGKNLSCSVSYKPVDADSTDAYNGTIYVSGNKMRMEFTTTADGLSMKSNIIQDGTNGYMWGSSPQGTMAIKFTVDPAQADVQKQQQFNLDQNVDYDCKNWSVDSSMFVPPSDIQFMDMSEMMNQAMPRGGADMKSAQCASCNQIGDASAKAQCLQALSCN